MRSVIQPYELNRKQHGGELPAAIPPAAFHLAHGAHRAQRPHDGIPFARAFPEVELDARTPDDFIERIAHPVEIGVICEHILFVADAENSDERRTGMESGG